MGMLLFIEKVNGDIIHNVGMIRRVFKKKGFVVTIINGFGQKEYEIEIPDEEISVVSSYDYNNR